MSTTHMTTVGAATSLGGGEAEATVRCRCGWSVTTRGPAATIISSARQIGDTHSGTPGKLRPEQPAYARHPRKLESKSTPGDEPVEGVQMVLGLTVVAGLVLCVVLIVFAIGKGVLGLFDGDDASPSNPQPSGPCPGLVEYLHENDPRSPVWKEVNKRFNRECLK